MAAKQYVERESTRALPSVPTFLSMLFFALVVAGANLGFARVWPERWEGCVFALLMAQAALYATWLGVGQTNGLIRLATIAPCTMLLGFVFHTWDEGYAKETVPLYLMVSAQLACSFLILRC